LVGGEIQLLHFRDFQYNLNLIQYFDRGQIDNPNPETEVMVFVFKNSDGEQVETFLLNFVMEEQLPTSNDDCQIDEVVNFRVFYTAEISLDPDIYNDPAGYPIVWDRCCRNEGIINIVTLLVQEQRLSLNFQL